MIRFGSPQVGSEEAGAIARVLESGHLVHGPRTREFEVAFANRLGAAHGVAVSNCTAGLFLSLRCLGVGAGDRVAVPALTHVACAHAVLATGAEVEFVDVDPVCGTMSPGALAASGVQVRAVMVVHYVLPADMAALGAVAGDVPVVEDCAICLDGRIGDTPVGRLGVCGAFSFYPVKQLTTIEGGMVVSDDPALAEALAAARSFGYDRQLGERRLPGVYDVVSHGLNMRMNDVQAAVGLVQLARLTEMQERRRAHFAALGAALAGADGLRLLPEAVGDRRTGYYCLNVELAADVDRGAVLAGLLEEGVEVSVHYPKALPQLRYYQERYGLPAGMFPAAEGLAARVVSLPVGPHLAPGDPERIAGVLRRVLSRQAAGR